MPELVLYVRATPMQVASALRRHFAQRGFEVLPPGSAEPAAIRFALAPAGDVGVTASPAEAVDELLAATLSQALRTRAVVAVSGDGIAALKRWEQGRLVEGAGAFGGEVVEGQGTTLAARLAGGELDAVLGELGVSPGGPGRAVEVSFGQRASRSGEEVVVDPTLSCPKCGAAMASRKGRYGAFWGCARYPACDGKLSAAQAAAARRVTD